MAVRVAHLKVSSVPDSDNTDLVRPSDWNADHVIEGLGTAAESDTGDFATAAQGAKADTALQPAAIGVTVQGYDADLAAWAGVNPSSYSTTAQIAAAYQPLDSDLTSWAGVTRAAGFDIFAATPSSANLASLVSDETGSGSLVLATSPTLVTPNLGTPSAVNLANGTNLPNSSVNGLGTAALVNTGTSGGTVPLLNGSPTFSGLFITLQNSTQFFPQMQIRSDYNGSDAGFVNFQKTRASAAAQVNDSLGSFVWQGADSAAALRNGASFGAVADAIASGTIDAYIQFSTSRSAATAQRMRIGAGVYHASATGTDKGNNTINFGAVYDDNTLLTCMAMAKEFLENGEVDLEKWDSLVPDQIVPESRETIPLTVEVAMPVERITVKRDDDGALVQRKQTSVEVVNLPELEPVWDEEGNGVDAVPVTEEIIVPETVIVREHRTARVFKAMIESGFDPRDPEQYFAKMQADEALPGMPTQADWVHNDLSIGEQFSRKWLAMEMLAIVCNVMWGKIKDHEARLAAAGL